MRSSPTFHVILAGALALLPRFAAAAADDTIFPGNTWATRPPAEVELDPAKLEALSKLVGGRGCVVRHGYLVYSWGEVAKVGDIASAMKPLLSTLLFKAIEEGRLKSVDERVADVWPELATLDGGKNAGITWRQLASQTSGYGLTEAPGAAYSYNDFALALYYDALMGKVFGEDGTQVFKSRLADPLEFQDGVTFEAVRGKPGRLGMSVRDLARLGLLYLREGRWRDQQLISPEHIRMAISSPIPAEMPRTAGVEAPMLPLQRSIGGTRNITGTGPGFYSFNWWLNRTDRLGNRLYADAPADTYVACGHAGKRMLWVVPSLDMVVAWNYAEIDDHDRSPGHPETRINQAARLIRESADGKLSAAPAKSDEGAPYAAKTTIAIRGDNWLINGKPTYPGAAADGLLLNVRMVNAIFEDQRRTDFDPAANTREFLDHLPSNIKHGVRAFTISLQGGYPGYERALNSAYRPDGSLRPEYLARARQVIERCDTLGAAVILSCFYQRQDQVLASEEAVRHAVIETCRWLRDAGYKNVLLEIANEYPHPGFGHKLLKTDAGEAELIALARREAPELLVSTSGLGDCRVADEVGQAADFLLVHFNGVPLEQIEPRLAKLKKYGKPIVCNEDPRIGDEGVAALEHSMKAHASWGLMHEKKNQWFPFDFTGADDDRRVYEAFMRVSRP
jgi:CubicO group peptidase (beta-lactamase class C family)